MRLGKSLSSRGGFSSVENAGHKGVVNMERVGGKSRNMAMGATGTIFFNRLLCIIITDARVAKGVQ